MNTEEIKILETQRLLEEQCNMYNLNQEEIVLEVKRNYPETIFTCEYYAEKVIVETVFEKTAERLIRLIKKAYKNLYKNSLDIELREKAIQNLELLKKHISYDLKHRTLLNYLDKIYENNLFNIVGKFTTADELLDWAITYTVNEY